MDAADRRRFHAERPRHRPAQRIDALAVRPDRQLPVPQLRDRAGRPQRGVRLIRPVIGRLDHLGAGRQQRRVLVADDGVLRRHRLQLLVEPRRIGQRGSGLPFRRSGQRLDRLDRLLLALGGDAQEAAVANHRDDAGHRAYLGFVERFELRAVLRRTRNAAVHHARQPQVLHERGAAGDLGRQIDARQRLPDQTMLRRRLRRDLAGRLALEIGLLGEFAIAHLAAVRRGDGAVGDLQAVGRNARTSWRPDRAGSRALPRPRAATRFRYFRPTGCRRSGLRLACARCRRK